MDLIARGETALTARAPPAPAADARPILIVPYMWIGDFVRCHSVVKLLKSRFRSRPVDVLTTPLTAPLIDYMPGVRKGILSELPRRRLALGRQRALAERLRAEGYGTALIMLRTWKSALAPWLAGIPERTGFVGEGRFILVNDLRWGERKLERMIDRCAALALPKDAPAPDDWPLPELVVPPREVAAWRERRGLHDGPPVVSLCPGAVGKGKRWPTGQYAELARRLTSEGISVWILGGPNETALAAEIGAVDPSAVRDLTGHDLRNAVLALKAADAAVSNDSGLLHVAAAIGVPTIGIFGPTAPRLWAPLNPIAAIIEPAPPACPTCGHSGCAVIAHRRTDDVSVGHVLDAVHRALAAGKPAAVT